METYIPVTNPLHRHKQFLVSACVGLPALVIALIAGLPLAYSVSVAADAFFVVFIALVLAKMPLLSGRYLSKNAREVDLPVLGIFAITLGVVSIAIVLLFLLINHKDRDPTELGIAMLSIPLGWFTIHAWRHFTMLMSTGWTATRSMPRPRRKPVGGLDFPGSKRPKAGISSISQRSSA